MSEAHSKKIRIDMLLLDRGLAESREKAKALILAGNVLVNGIVIDKPGALVRPEDDLSIKDRLPYVSRGGLKLAHALKEFNIDVNGKTAMDIGASTGGFTDCLLQHGAKKVYAIDVGYGQFEWSLRRSEKVFLMEKTNIRYLDRDMVPDEIDIAAVDVSFISLLKVMPNISGFLKTSGEVVALIKPQFEAGRKDVGKGGVVRDEARRLEIVSMIKTEFENMGFDVLGTTTSPVKGPKGNVEYLIYSRKKQT
ncbi:MAG: TlyA family RNA methyltransferase [Nitrospirota bacterium]|nr:TlyA family RNA methyltransferase [Nitrospirota bacterium]